MSKIIEICRAKQGGTITIGTRKGRFTASDVFAIALIKSAFWHKEMTPLSFVVERLPDDCLDACDIRIGTFDAARQMQMLSVEICKDLMPSLGFKHKAQEDEFLQFIRGIDVSDISMPKYITVRTLGRIIGDFNTPDEITQADAMERAIDFAEHVLINEVRRLRAKKN